MTTEHCNNCGFPLTEENILLAVEDAGIPQEELSFCCPSYSQKETTGGNRYEACSGYSVADRTLPAYWRTN